MILFYAPPIRFATLAIYEFVLDIRHYYDVIFIIIIVIIFHTLGCIAPNG